MHAARQAAIYRALQRRRRRRRTPAAPTWTTPDRRQAPLRTAQPRPPPSEKTPQTPRPATPRQPRPPGRAPRCPPARARGPSLPDGPARSGSASWPARPGGRPVSRELALTADDWDRGWPRHGVCHAWGARLPSIPPDSARLSANAPWTRSGPRPRSSPGGAAHRRSARVTAHCLSRFSSSTDGEAHAPRRSMRILRLLAICSTTRLMWPARERGERMDTILQKIYRLVAKKKVHVERRRSTEHEYGA